MVLKCEYGMCNKEAISNGNVIIDTEGETYDVALCKYHLNKLIKNNRLLKEEIRK